MTSPIGLFVPCYVDELWPQAGRAAVELLEICGFRVVVAEALCCGQAHSNAGERAEAARVRAFWEAAHGRMSEVVVLSASCAGHLAGTAPRSGGPRVREFCEWFAAVGPGRFPRAQARTLALHTSCSSLRETKTAWAARDLLGRVPELQVTEPHRYDECCGFGGSFSATFAELSVKIGADKVADLVASAAGRPDGVVSADCSCMLHLKGIAPPELPFFHVAEVLREAVS